MTDIVHLPVEDVYENPRHYREVRDADVARLAESIGVIGQVEPITVYRDGNIYRIDSGHHRVAALRLLGAKTVAALVLDDMDETRSASVMVASNMHVPVTELEVSRGTQLMLSTGVRPEQAAKLAGVPENVVAGASKALQAVADPVAAADMTLDRLLAIGEFADDAEAVGKLLHASENEWERIARDLRGTRRMEAKRAEAEAIVEAAGVPLVDEADDTMSYLVRSWEVPEGAVAARIQVLPWAYNVELHWYASRDEGADAEASAEREAREAHRAALEAASERRVAFVVAYLNDSSESPSNALRDAAWRLWHGGVDASAREAFEGVTGDMARFYASVLARVESRTRSLFWHRDKWGVENYGPAIVEYLDALVECGLELSPVEVEARDPQAGADSIRVRRDVVRTSSVA